MSFAAVLERNLLKPPYRWVPLAVFLFLELAFLSGVVTRLPVDLLDDPDDYMRLNQTMAWMQGQGWFDLGQPRLSPGAHTIIHWARCVDVPIALAAAPLIGLLGLREAVLMGGMIAPILPLLILIALIPMIARPFMGRARARLALVYMLAAPLAVGKFGPGRVDHHNWETVIACVGFAGLLYALLCPQGWRMALAAAVAMAFGLWIGEEILPFLALMTGCLALVSAWRGGFALRNAAVFGCGLALSTLALLPVALPMVAWGHRDVSWFSSAYVILAVIVAACLVANWQLGRRTANRWLRVGLTLALGFMGMALFVLAVPDALVGPFANYDDYNGATVLESIDEAMPFVDYMHKGADVPFGWAVMARKASGFLLAPCAAFLFCLVAFGTRSSARSRMLWGIYGAFLGLLLGLGLLVQGRVLWFAQALQFAPLAYLTWLWWDRYAGRWTLWARLRARMLSFLLVGLLPVTLVPYATGLIAALGQPSDAKAATGPLALRPAAEYIADHYRDRVYTILNPPNEGPGLLFYTQDNVVAGNFNVSGNADVAAFFAATDDEKALAILRKWKADMVFMSGKGSAPKAEATDEPATLGRRLAEGKIPAWLKPVEIPGATGYLLFEAHVPPITTPDEDKVRP